MTQLKSLCVAGVLLLPALAFAETHTYRCHAPHVVRATGPAVPDPVTGVAPTELRFTVVFFSNGDLEHRAVIKRITWRDAFGAVRHDSGPNSPTAAPHPLVLGQDITNVPPGGNFAFATTTLWGLNDAPFVTPTPAGTFLSTGTMTVEVASPNPRLVRVHARDTVRHRNFPDPSMPSVSFGEERASQAARCFRIRDRD